MSPSSTLSNGRIWQRTGMLAGNLPIVVPNHDVRISALCGEHVGVPPSHIVVFAMAVLAGDDLIRTVENPKPVDRHGPRALLWRGPRRSVLFLCVV
jgi:hypothetical protein